MFIYQNWKETEKAASRKENNKEYFIENKIEIMIKKLYFLTKSFLNLMFSVLAIRSITSIFTNDAHYINNLK